MMVIEVESQIQAPVVPAAPKELEANEHLLLKEYNSQIESCFGQLMDNFKHY